MIVYVLAFLGLAILLMYITGMGAALAVFISITVLFAISRVISNIEYKRQKENEKYIIFNEDTDTAKLIRRSEVSASLLIIEDIQDTYTRRSSGKCHIIAKCAGKSIVEVKNIELPKDLLREARKDETINKFVVNDKLVLRYDTPDTKLTREENEVLKRAIQSFDTSLQDRITQRAFIASMPTKEDCLAVKKWISGK